jgi:hypothetical protein
MEIFAQCADSVKEKQKKGKKSLFIDKKTG